MKKIEAIQIWDNGQTKNAEILNAYAVNVTLGQSATFYYSLMSADKMQLAQGNLVMSGDDYQAWDNDDVAWDFVAKELNLVIIGDWVEPEVDIDETANLLISKYPLFDALIESQQNTEIKTEPIEPIIEPIIDEVVEPVVEVTGEVSEEVTGEVDA